MVSPQAQHRHDFWRSLRRSVPETPPTVAELRAGDPQLLRLGRDPEGVLTRPEPDSPVPAEWAEPERPTQNRVIQYLHGGGFAFGSILSHRRLVGHIARAAECRVLSLDYRLAPEHPYPAALDDAVAVYRWLRTTEPSAAICIAGDSAGAGLALSTLIRLRDCDDIPPAAGVLMSPLADLTLAASELETDTDLLIDLAVLRQSAAMYAGAADLHEPLLSPLRADLRGLPPILLQAGGDESLVGQSQLLEQRIREQGGAVHLDVYPHMQHAFQLCAGYMPEADEAVRQIGRFISSGAQQPTAMSENVES